MNGVADDIPIIWRKEDAAQTTIAVGGLIVAAEYRDRASASNNNRGSTLKIGIANVSLTTSRMNIFCCNIGRVKVFLSLQQATYDFLKDPVIFT